MAKENGKSDLAQDKAMIRKGVGQHEAARHKGQPKTTLNLKKGGPTSEDRMRLGRGLSRVASQKTG